MARLVASMAMAHAPGVTGWLDSAPAEEQHQILSGYEEMGRRFRAARPDLVIGIANDHMLNMPLKSSPDFCVGTAECWSGPAEFFRDWLKLDEYHVPGHPEAAQRIIEAFEDAGVSHTSSSELLFDDNWSVPLHFLTPEYDVPLVPIHMNCINPPIPGPEANYRAGEALGRAISEMAEDLRVAVIGTGGRSHEPGGKRYFSVDEGFDRDFLNLLATGDVDRIIEESTVERMEKAGGGGTAELQAWIVALGAARYKKAQPVFYVPSIEMRCGIGGVAWDSGA